MCLLYCACHAKFIFAEPRQISPCLPTLLKLLQNLHVLLTFGKVQNPFRLPGKTTSEPPKVAQTHQCFYTFDFAPQRMHFCDISTSKSGPNMGCFVHFGFEICFAPQRPAIFMSHLAKWLRTRRFSEPTFRPSGSTNHWKNTVNRDVSTFSRTCIFFPLTLSLL